MTIDDIAPAFVDMAHRIVWATAATVDRRGRPRTRILHPIWEWADGSLTGWIATGPTPAKRSDLEVMPRVSLNYWSPNHDTCRADCDATWCFDDETRSQVWDRFAKAPAPVGYDPALIPVWSDGPRSEAFAVLRLDPYLLRVYPGSLLSGGGGELLSWSAGR